MRFYLNEYVQNTKRCIHEMLLTMFNSIYINVFIKHVAVKLYYNDNILLKRYMYFMLLTSVLYNNKSQIT